MVGVFKWLRCKLLSLVQCLAELSTQVSSVQWEKQVFCVGFNHSHVFPICLLIRGSVLIAGLLTHSAFTGTKMAQQKVSCLVSAQGPFWFQPCLLLFIFPILWSLTILFGAHSLFLGLCGFWPPGLPSGLWTVFYLKLFAEHTLWLPYTL